MSISILPIGFSLLAIPCEQASKQAIKASTANKQDEGAPWPFQGAFKGGGPTLPQHKTRGMLYSVLVALLAINRHSVGHSSYMLFRE